MYPTKIGLFVRSIFCLLIAFVFTRPVLATKVTLYPSADTAILENHPTSTTYKSSTSLDLGGRQPDRVWAAMRFNLTSIPKNSRIISANLYVFTSYRDDLIYVLPRRITGSWAESSLTWNNRPSSTGLSGNGFIAGNVGVEGVINVKDLVEGWIVHHWDNNGLYLVGSNGNSTAVGSIYSREGPSIYRPQLVVEYDSTTSPTVPIILLPTRTPTPTIRLIRTVSTTPTPTIRIVRIVSNTPTPSLRIIRTVTNTSAPVPATNCTIDGRPRIFIQNLRFEELTADRAWIAWDTKVCTDNGIGFFNHDTTSWVYVDQNATEQQNPMTFDQGFGNYVMTANHRVPLNNLLPGTTYKYRVTGHDRNNILIRSPLLEFTTPKIPDDTNNSVDGDLSPAGADPDIPPAIDLPDDVDGGQNATMVEDGQISTQNDDGSAFSFTGDKSIDDIVKELVVGNKSSDNYIPFFVIIIIILIFILLIVIFRRSAAPTVVLRSKKVMVEQPKKTLFSKILLIIFVLIVLKVIFSMLSFWFPFIR